MAVGSDRERRAGAVVIDAGRSVVMPGLVDTHVHINEPGRADWEGFETATRAAAAGGVTTLIDMPLNSVPATTTIEALAAKRESAAGRCSVDVGFWGGVVPGNLKELAPLFEAGVFGFKCFLVPSGVDEFRHVDEADLRSAMPRLAEIGALLLAHAETPGPIEKALRRLAGARPTSYRAYLDARPDSAEHEAVSLLVKLAAEFGSRIHIVHLSSAGSLPLLSSGRAHKRVTLTVETCPHYLRFAAEEIPDGATPYKCAPPIRSRPNREALWRALGDEQIEMVVSDHSPSPAAMKCLDSGDFRAAWGGIASLQLGLSAVWTGAEPRGYAVEDIAKWMCEAPAKLAGLDNRKGRLAPGYDADLVIWDPEAEFRVEKAMLYDRHRLTPYEGELLKGRVEMTLLRGESIFNRGVFAEQPSGRLLKRTGGRIS